VPEPETYALIAVGIVFLGFTARGRAATAKFKIANPA
jgi:PEP-CTERM motif-containing protein